MVYFRNNAEPSEVLLAINGGVQQQEQGDLLEFGEDFLNVDAKSPIQALQRMDLNTAGAQQNQQRRAQQQTETVQQKPNVAKMQWKFDQTQQQAQIPKLAMRPPGTEQLAEPVVVPNLLESEEEEKNQFDPFSLGEQQTGTKKQPQQENVEDLFADFVSS